MVQVKDLTKPGLRDSWGGNNEDHSWGDVKSQTLRGVKRLLEGSPLALVSTDGRAVLHAALDTVYPNVPRQRCWAHKMPRRVGVTSKLPRKTPAACLAGAKLTCQARTRRQAVARFRQWAAIWREAAPNAVKCIEDGLEELLPFFDCPEQHWKKVRTTNAIEMSFREVRRRTRPMS